MDDRQLHVGFIYLCVHTFAGELVQGFSSLYNGVDCRENQLALRGRVNIVRSESDKPVQVLFIREFVTIDDQVGRWIKGVG